MTSAKMLVSGLLGAVLLVASSARAQEDFSRHEVDVQGAGRMESKTEDCNTRQTLAASC